MTYLDAELNRLEAAASAQGLAECFRPGLSEMQIDELEARLAPFRLPDEVRSMYRWHNGAEESFSMLPPYRFLGFAEALAAYDQVREFMPGDEGWNPLWFPLFSFQGDHHCTVLSANVRAGSPIYVAHNADTEIRQIFPDLRSLISTVADGYSNGALWLADGYVESDQDRLLDIAMRHGHTQFKDAMDGVTSFSIFQTALWPDEWKAAIGRTADGYRAKGADGLAADAARSGDVRTLQAEIIWLAGSSDECVLKIKDSSGTLMVQCPRTAVGAREIQIGRQYELRVRFHDVITSSLAQSWDMHCDAVVEHVVRLG